MFEKLKKILGIISKYDIATPKDALKAFVVALEKADKDANGMINVKELLVLYKDTLLYVAIKPSVTDDEVVQKVKDVLKEE